MCPECLQVRLTSGIVFAVLCTGHAVNASSPDLFFSSPYSLLVGVVLGAHVDPVLEKRLREEAPAAWQELQELSSNQKGRYYQSKSWGGNDSALDVAFAVNGENIKAAIQRGELQYVIARNDDYAFSVTKSSTDPNGRFTIQWLEQRGADTAVDAEIQDRGLQYDQNVNAAWFFMDQAFSDWLDEPGFEVHGIQAEGESEEDLVRVEFSYQPDESHPTGIEPIPSGSVVFDAGNKWVIREILMNVSWGAQKTVYTYADGESDLPKITERRIIAMNEQGESTVEIATHYEDIEHETTPVEEFRLSYFGLPEPNFERSWVSTWLMYIFGGAICFSVAYWFRQRQQLAA